MTYITVDATQAELILTAGESIEIRDHQGRHLGFVAHGFSDEDVEVAANRGASDEPRYSTDEVLRHLRGVAGE